MAYAYPVFADASSFQGTLGLSDKPTFIMPEQASTWLLGAAQNIQAKNNPAIQGSLDCADTLFSTRDR